jgi:hypothetical protein
MALKSDFDYTAESGFTLKRLYGYAVVAWITGILFLYFIKLTTKYKDSLFVQSITIYSVIIFTIINISNFDYIVYHQDKFEDEEDLEHEFLSKLSPDALSYHEQLSILSEKLQESCDNSYEERYKDQQALNNLTKHIEYLKEKYEKGHTWQSFNFSEYREYKRIEKYLDDYPEEYVIVCD